ncbi:MAG TPA: hypothetical protein VM534_04395, partial [Thermoanaerobaculia bacterium]|nr:hypothetical protein [Thermoanaerobaculia bacterium]
TSEQAAANLREAHTHLRRLQTAAPERVRRLLVDGFPESLFGGEVLLDFRIRFAARFGFASPGSRLAGLRSIRPELEGDRLLDLAWRVLSATGTAEERKRSLANWHLAFPGTEAEGMACLVHALEAVERYRTTGTDLATYLRVVESQIEEASRVWQKPPFSERLCHLAALIGIGCIRTMRNPSLSGILSGAGGPDPNRARRAGS